MRTLSLGLSGDDVSAWQAYLVTQGFTLIVAGGFDNATKMATVAFQQKHGLSSDGSVGPNTLNYAVQHGFMPPGAPTPAPPVTHTAPFRWVAAPTPNDPDHITIMDGWAAANIVTFSCPYVGAGIKLTLNKAVIDDFQAWMKAVQDANLMSSLGPLCGAYNPRYKRAVPHDDNPAHISNHASGHAVDFDAARLPLGVVVPSNDKMRDIVPIAAKHNFNWGGNFRRIDGMHYQHVTSPFP